MAAIDLKIPPSVLNPPAQTNLADSPAVAAGNVETSQRVVDCLLGAFGAAAASQGTMNNCCSAILDLASTKQFAAAPAQLDTLMAFRVCIRT